MQILNFSLAHLFSAIALSQLCLLFVLLSIGITTVDKTRLILLVFVSGVIAYVLGPFLQSEWAIQIHMSWQTLVPGTLWLFCGSLFDDEFSLSASKFSLVVCTVLPPTIARALGLSADGWQFLVLFALPQALEFLLMAWAIFYVLRTWRDDLVQSRRDLRLWFCLFAGGYSFLLILIREVVFPNAQWWQDLQFVWVACACIAVNLFLLRPKVGQLAFSEMSQLKQQPRSSVTDEGNDKTIAKLAELMENKNLYRQMSLTIGEVAEKVECPEHQLRKVINQGLGYRNFNGYLNQYRVAEACRKLADNSNPNEAILNIALDVGFRSLSSFNTAFKAKTGKTPTEYREDSLTNSEKA